MEHDSHPEQPSGAGVTGDSWPEVYARWRPTTLGQITEHLERALILDLLGPVASRRVLDVGCGDGDLALDLWRHQARVAAIDASAAMLDSAREQAAREHARIDFEVARAEALPFQSGSFDAVVAVTILCFVPDARAVFHEMARVLRPGGRLVIGELNRWSSWAAARRVRGWLGSSLWRDRRFHTAGELRAHADAAGLRIEEVRGGIFYPRAAWLARSMAAIDPWLGRRTTVGAAFVAISAVKPG